MTLIYKISPEAAWRQAVADGIYRGAPIDLADGFIHFSTADQVAGTLAKHFAGETGLVLVAFDDATLGAELRYEPARGGALFPHLYAPLDPALALWVRAIGAAADGGHVLPDLGIAGG